METGKVHICNTTSLTTLPTAAAVFDLLTPVPLVHDAMDHVPILHVHGIREDQRMVGEA